MMRLGAAISLFLVVAAAAATEPLSATNARIDEVLGPHKTYEATIVALKEAVAHHNSKAVAALTLYPMRATFGGRTVIVRTPAEFMARYDQILTPAVAKLIVSQRYDTLFVNAQGVMFGNGEVWISASCADHGCSHAKVGIRTIQHGPWPKSRS